MGGFQQTEFRHEAQKFHPSYSAKNRTARGLTIHNEFIVNAKNKKKQKKKEHSERENKKNIQREKKKTQQASHLVRDPANSPRGDKTGWACAVTAPDTLTWSG